MGVTGDNYRKCRLAAAAVILVDSLLTLTHHSLVVDAAVASGSRVHRQLPVCATYFRLHGEHCYMLPRRGERAHAFDEGRRLCEGLNSTLFIPDSAQETLLILNSTDTTTPVWIGLRREAQGNGVFTWLDGRPLDVSSADAPSKWAPGYPSSEAGRDCVMMLPEAASHSAGAASGEVQVLMNTECERRASIICKATPGMVSRDCPQTWINVNNQCYKLMAGRKSWSSAATQCSQEVGDSGTDAAAHLITVKGIAQDYSISQAATEVSESSPNVWLGYKRKLENSDAGEWQWQDTCDQSDGDTVDYTNWAPGQPLDSDDELCAAYNLNSGTWYSDQCDKEYLYVCQLGSSCDTSVTTDPPVDVSSTETHNGCVKSKPSATAAGLLTVLLLVVVVTGWPAHHIHLW